MRGQQGIGTILIMIAVVLTAVIAAFVLIQMADRLRTQAFNVQKEQESLILDRVLIKEVSGIVGTCGTDRCVRYLLIKTSLAPGSNPLDLTKTLMGFVTSDIALQGIRYVPPEDLYWQFDNNDTYLAILASLAQDENLSPYPACRMSLLNVMDHFNTYDISMVAYYIDPFRDDNVDTEIGSFYTALWTDCYNKGDTHSLLRSQEIMIFYRPKYPLYPSEEFTIELGTSQGYSVSKDLMVPRGLEGKMVRIFP